MVETRSGTVTSRQQVLSMLCSALFSADCTLSPQAYVVRIHILLYVQCYAALAALSCGERDAEPGAQGQGRRVGHSHLQVVE